MTTQVRRGPSLPALPGQAHRCAEARRQIHAVALRRALGETRQALAWARAAELTRDQLPERRSIAEARRALTTAWIEDVRLTSEFGWDLYRRFYDAARWGVLCECGVTLPSLPAAVAWQFPDVTGYNVYGPVSAANLQTEINNIGTGAGGHAASDLTNGVIIKVTAGTSATLINLAFKSMAAGKWIVIRPDDAAYALLPASGTRVSTADAAHMWQILPPLSAEGGIMTDQAPNAAANHYRIVGCDLRPPTVAGDPAGVLALINLGGQNQGLHPSSPSALPDFIIIDRCHLLGNTSSAQQTIRNGIIPNTRTCAVVDTYFDRIWLSGAESHCFSIVDCVGPLLIQNCYIGDASIGCLTGGVGSSLSPPDVTSPHDYTVRRCYFKKTPGLFRSAPFFNKNHWELKRGQRVLVEACKFESMWQEFGDQNGSFMQMTVRSELQAGGRIDDVTIRWNWFVSAGAWFNAVGRDGSANSLGDERANRLYVHDNLVDDVNRGAWNSASDFATLDVQNGYVDVTMDHNTYVLRGATTSNGYLYLDNLSLNNLTNFSWTNNLNNEQQGGVMPPAPNGNVTGLLNSQCGAGVWTFTNNGISPGTVSAGYPAGQLNVPSATFTGASYFTDYANGMTTALTNTAYKLLPGVTGKGAGKAFGTGAADGTDIGISNYDTWVTMLVGVVTGAPESGGAPGATAERGRVTDGLARAVSGLRRR